MRLEVDEVTAARAQLIGMLPVGARVFVRQSFSLAQEKTKGWVIEEYELGGRPGRTICFENGEHDGFAPGELERFIWPEGTVDADLAREMASGGSQRKAIEKARRGGMAAFERSFEQAMADFARWEGAQIRGQLREGPAEPNASRPTPRV
jgi:hypothetical protein